MMTVPSAMRTLSSLCSAAVLLAGAAGPTSMAQALPAIEPPVRIVLHPQASVEEEKVTLGAIADVTSGDPVTQQRLIELPLGRAPKAGEPVKLDRDALTRWIRARTGIEPAQIAWAGPAVTLIVPTVHTVKGEQIAQVARDELQSVLTQGGLRAEIDLIQAPRDLDVPAGKTEFKPRAQNVAIDATRLTASTGGTLAKRQSVWVDIWVEGRFIRTVPVGFTVSVYAPAYIAVQNLAAGFVFDPDHVDPAQLAVREIEWSGRLTEPVKPPVPSPAKAAAAAAVPRKQPAAPLKLRRPLPAGQPVTRSDVVTAPLVAQGDYATLHSVSGPIELESRVQVLQDGSAGQMIRVKLPKASSAVLARVTGPGQVEIRE
jgi:flagellar basal body P-ring formation protein FlgA